MGKRSENSKSKELCIKTIGVELQDSSRTNFIVYSWDIFETMIERLAAQMNQIVKKGFHVKLIVDIIC